jgi:nitroreductase
MPDILEIIKKRRSVRTFADKPVEEKKKGQIRNYCQKNREGPFGNKVNFEFVQIAEDDMAGLMKLGTYGMISGTRLYLAGSIRPAVGAMEDFGFVFESALLKCTELGLGTCWLGGFLSRSAFAEKINPPSGWVIPAVTPVGYPADKMTLAEKTIRGFIRASNRKDFSDLFFDGHPGKGLTSVAAGPFLSVLEAVRQAPSASNKQPWRVIVIDGSFHFYLDEDKAYNNIFAGIQLQNMDLGIAMCHFAMAADAIGKKGEWDIGAEPKGLKTSWKHIITWNSGKK